MPAGQISVKDLIRQEAAAAGVPEELALSIAEQESSFNPMAQGPPIPHLGGTRAIGTFQLLPTTAQMMGVDPNDPAENIRGGVKYLRQLLDQHNGDLDKVIGTYGGVKTNTTYVPQVMARFPRWQRGTSPTGSVAVPPPAPPQGPLSKFFEEATQGVNPVNIYQGVKALATTNPVTTLENFVGAHVRPVMEGYYEGAIPLIGPRLAEAHKFAEQGEYAKALGAGVDVAGQVFGPTAIGKLGGKVQLTPRIFKPRLTGPQAAAVQLGRDAGVTMDVATASGSRFARNITQAAEATPVGGAVHEVVRGQRQAQLSALAEELAGRVHPTPVTPGEAGVTLRGTAGDYLGDQQTLASSRYDVVDQIAADPAHRQLVQTGTRPSNTWTPQGTIQPVQVPIMEWVQAPTDIRQIKAAAAPVLAEIKATMPLGQQQYSKGLLALENLMKLRDFEPVTVVERNLGALKRVARGAEHPALKSLEQGTAAHAIGDVSRAVDQTMARLGPQAQQALAEGRAAAKAKWAAEDLFDTVNTEPVAGFRAVTGSGDLHAEALAEVARVAPQEIPHLGRAVLENIFDHARGMEQGWSRSAGAANMWQKLGPETKRILFGQNVDDLDRFFLLQKMLGEQANPSRTALVSTSVGSLAAVAASPFWGALGTLGAGGFAALMNSRAGIKLLTEGLTLQTGTARAAAWAAAVAQAVGKESDPSHGGLRITGLEGGSQVAQPPPTPPPTTSQVATPPPTRPRRRRYVGGSRWIRGALDG